MPTIAAASVVGVRGPVPDPVLGAMTDHIRGAVTVEAGVGAAAGTVAGVILDPRAGFPDPSHATVDLRLLLETAPQQQQTISRFLT
jgi:hypothetical protein